MAFGILALMVASLFTGAAIHMAFVEHPARAVLDPGPQLEAWKPSYARSAAMRASLAVIGFALGMAAWWQTRDFRWLGGALLLVASWPFTLIILAPTNKALRTLYPGQATLESRALLERWGHLHAIRTVFGMGGAYLNGILAVVILFSSESLPRANVDRFPSLISNFKMATASLVEQKRWFAAR